MPLDTNVSYLKLTDSVARGLKYLAVMADVDSAFELVRFDDNGGAIPIGSDTGTVDVAAAGRWIRYQLSKRDKD